MTALTTHRPATQPPYRLTLTERVEAFISRLSTRNNFWHRVCSLIWLPYAFNSGIRMRRVVGGDGNVFTAVLPFRRFNKNWYNAMAGASLLANSEIAGGMYLFAKVGAGYTVVCKELTYKFLRPCHGPAIYKCETAHNLDELIATGKEFNAEIDLTIIQQRLPLTGHGGRKGRRRRGHAAQAPELAATEAQAEGHGPPAGRAGKPERELRVGRCRAVFHVTPKRHHAEREHRRPAMTAR